MLSILVLVSLVRNSSLYFQAFHAYSITNAFQELYNAKKS